MASSSLTTFCVANELEAWIRTLQEHWALEALVFDDGVEEGRLSSAPQESKLGQGARALYLFPRDSRPLPPFRMNDMKPRDLGWIDVRPGWMVRRDDRRLLLMSELHGE